MRVIITDKRYGALKTLGERKQAFNEVISLSLCEIIYVSTMHAMYIYIYVFVSIYVRICIFSRKIREYMHVFMYVFIDVQIRAYTRECVKDSKSLFLF